MKARLVARKLTALQAAALLLDDASGDLQTAGATLAGNLKGLTGVQVQECLRTKGIEVTLDFALKLQIDAVVQREGGEVAVVQLHHEHPVAAVDGDDGAGAHGGSVDELRAALGGMTVQIRRRPGGAA